MSEIKITQNPLMATCSNDVINMAAREIFVCIIFKHILGLMIKWLIILSLSFVIFVLYHNQYPVSYLNDFELNLHDVTWLFPPFYLRFLYSNSNWVDKQVGFFCKQRIKYVVLKIFYSRDPYNARNKTYTESLHDSMIKWRHQYGHKEIDFVLFPAFACLKW